MARIEFNKSGERFYETGVRNTVLYVQNSNGEYGTGVAWNGVTNITEKPTGAEPTPLYADDTKYVTLTSVEELEAAIEAYTYPDEFMECDGSAELAPGVTVGQQPRKSFGLCYRTSLGNDIAGNDYGYKLHLIYGAKASVSEKAYSTINDNPEANTCSWDLSTTPVEVDGMKPTSLVTIDSTKVDSAKLKELEDMLYGTETAEPTLPMPNEIAALFGKA